MLVGRIWGVKYKGKNVNTNSYVLKPLRMCSLPRVRAYIVWKTCKMKIRGAIMCSSFVMFSCRLSPIHNRDRPDLRIRARSRGQIYAVYVYMVPKTICVFITGTRDGIPEENFSEIYKTKQTEAINFVEVMFRREGSQKTSSSFKPDVDHASGSFVTFKCVGFPMSLACGHLFFFFLSLTRI